MAAQSNAEIELPELPAKHDQFLEYLNANGSKPMAQILEPYRKYDSEMRKIFAQQPQHAATREANVVPIFTGHETSINIRARNLEAESESEKECYIMPLQDEHRRPHGSPAVVQSLKEFRTNFNVFSESALADLDWDNVVAAGSAVVTSLLAVPKKHAGSKRALREYYHEQLAPASDVDLFIYGLSEEEAKNKIKTIEQNIRDAILVETTTIRTKNAITIASQYPTRHVQIVLRIYRSISEILTGFDVDCSCAAYDGKQVWASPRAIAAYITQINHIDLTRRSPSYESRLSKYAHRGFEVYWPTLDRSRIDPTIFERSFGRTEGLARLLILEKLPKSSDRDAYLDQRRAERGRPAVNRWRMNRRQIHGNIKNDHEDEVAEWVDSDEVSDYHTFTVPYGPKFHARKIEKLFYTKDLLLNAEWNLPKDREVHLHRHPAFFGTAEDVFGDCCGYCPIPATIEEEEVAEEESKVYISGPVQFIKDDPGRQQIGSFNPLTPDDWTEMAYVGNTELLCKAIVDGDDAYVRSWLQQDGNDPNTRDYTGRTPLHLAASSSTIDVLTTLIDGGARLVARLVDGRTALHLAAMRGDVEMVSALLRKSEANEEERDRIIDARRAARTSAKTATSLDVALKDVSISPQDEDVEMVEDVVDEDIDATTENSLINVKPNVLDAHEKALSADDEGDEPDVYDVNILAWDTGVSPLHLAVLNGHIDVVKCLVQDFGADVLLPVKLFDDNDHSARAAILTLVLALQLPAQQAEDMARVLVGLGASSAQADMEQTTALQFCVAERPEIIDLLTQIDSTGVARAINHLSMSSFWHRAQAKSPLMTAILAKDNLTALKLLTRGAKPDIGFSAYMKAYQVKREAVGDSAQHRRQFEQTIEQPVINAVRHELPDLARSLVDEFDVDVNTIGPSGWIAVHNEYSRGYTEGRSLLDEVQMKLKGLREWVPEERIRDPPIPLAEESTYFSALNKGSYEWWSAQKQFDAAKDKYERDLQQYHRDIETTKSVTGLPEKQAAIEDMVKRFERLEAVLVDRGAKRFQELFPDIEKPQPRTGYPYHQHTTKPKPFEVNFSFQLPDLTDECQKQYLKLFDAVWRADLATIKDLTLMTWQSSEGEEQAPLKIAVQDQHDLSPLAIAMFQGQFELASAIMEIAQAQYVPSEEDSRQERYRLDGADSQEEHSEDQEGIQLVSEVIDDEFTVDNIGEVSVKVKSHVTPLVMLQWNCPALDFLDQTTLQTPYSSNGHTYFGPRRSHDLRKPVKHRLSEQKMATVDPPRNLIQFALHNDDSHALIFLINLANEYNKTRNQDDSDTKELFCSTLECDYIRAIQLDRPHLLAELVKRSGAGLPFKKMIKSSGMEATEKPKYYQGLNVHGRKRKDWADAGRGHNSNEALEDYRPGLLEAARYQSLETIEWFLSDAPLRCYDELAATFGDDKRIKLVAEAKGGFRAAVARFLNARAKLAMHCCVLGDPVPEAIEVLNLLVKAMPDAIDFKSNTGHTPLSIAFQLYREEAAKILIAAGSNQTVRDNERNNIVHHLLSRHIDEAKELENLSTMLDLIDKRLLSTLFIERSHEHPGSLNPLARLLTWATAYGHNSPLIEQALRTVLRYSSGEELNMINGDGHTALHVACRQNSLPIARAILEHDPTLLLRENATGLTPYEMAEAANIASYVAGAPPLPGNFAFNDRRARIQGLSREWSSDLVRRSSESFMSNSVGGRRSDGEQLWSLFRTVKAQLEVEGRAKRRLVTLNEANEVARRLAMRERRRPRRSHQAASSVRDDGDEQDAQDEAQDEVQDEVQLWMWRAKVFLE